MNDDAQHVDSAAILRSIADDSIRARNALAPNARLLYAAWGVAWIVGFVALILAFFPKAGPLIPLGAGVAIACAALAAAIASSVVHSAKRSAGTRGPSRVQDAIYGATYPLAFLVTGVIGWRLSSAGVPTNTMLSYWITATCLIVAILFLAGAAMWNDKSQLIFGIWTSVVALAAIALPGPYSLFAGVAGGVGFLVIAIIQTIRPALTSGRISRGADG